MRRRNAPEPSKPRQDPTRLVVRNALSQVVEGTPLEAYADLQGVLAAARAGRGAYGWECERIGNLCDLCFCGNGGCGIWRL